MSSPNAILHIEGEMTIYQAGEQRANILGALEQSARLELNLAGVTELDTAGVQVLLLAKKAALADGRQLELVAHSPAVLDVFELLHLSAFFGDPMVIAPRPT
ncbi:MAG: STAS domain-containing protein [Pseudomonadota bacterium]